MALVGAKVSVHEGISGHFEQSLNEVSCGVAGRSRKSEG
jgi:hypothetical protein